MNVCSVPATRGRVLPLFAAEHVIAWPDALWQFRAISTV